MPRPRSRLALIAAALAPFGVSCSSSVTDPASKSNVPALSASEVSAVAGGLFSQASGTAGRSTATRNSDGSYTYVQSCPLGGTISAVLTAGAPTTNSDGSQTVTSTVVTTPQACVVGTGARQITLTGNPAETVRSTTTVGPGSAFTSTSAVTGGFKWDGGSCDLSFTAVVKGTGSSSTSTITGTVCGQSVNTTITS